MDNRNYHFTKSSLYNGIIRCKSNMEDIDGEFKVDVARSFVKDSNYGDGAISKVRGKTILDVLEMYPDSVTSNIRRGIADLIIRENFDEIGAILRAQLFKYTAKSCGVSEEIFYGDRR